MSRILHLMNLSQRYGGSKGCRACRLEDGVLSNLAPPGDLEESASHHFLTKQKIRRPNVGVFELSSEEVYLLL